MTPQEQNGDIRPILSSQEKWFHCLAKCTVKFPKDVLGPNQFFKTSRSSSEKKYEKKTL
jgi:hypothetical protein